MCVNMVFDTIVVKSPTTGLDLSLGQFNVEKGRHISLLLLLLLLKVARNISKGMSLLYYYIFYMS